MTHDDTPILIERIVRLTVNMLETLRQDTGEGATPEDVREQVAIVAGRIARDRPDNAALIEAAISQIEQDEDILLDNLFLSPTTTAAGAAGAWEPGLPSPYLQRYLRLLEQDGWSADSLQRLMAVTRRILGQCGNPTVTGSWDIRGMIVGDVQSGKTTSYTALICAAIDAGYRNVVVLGGRTNDLRHQTQERIDLGVVGKETSGGGAALIGVGRLSQIAGLPTLSLTSQDRVVNDRRIGGDFDTNRANHNNLSGEAVRIAVIKKHATMIDNVAGWLENNGNLATSPLLLIDDEADDASIDTRDPDQMPTAINGAIRRLLERTGGDTGRSSYIAYTATPYANVMIPPEANKEGHGDDLFPRDFIAILRPPPNYFGARRFLMEEGRRSHTVGVRDSTTWLNKGRIVGGIPLSLQDAIREFILVSAVRRVRLAHAGSKKVHHETMLIHPSVSTSVHEAVHDQVEAEVIRLRSGWNHPVAVPGSAGTVYDEFQRTWRRLEHRQEADGRVTWEQLEPHISEVFESANGLRRLRVETINGETKTGLDYRRSLHGLTVIAVGGTKLSRGLTLEGLTTSYHLRASLQHDSLMQMCRWFGYRMGYEDLCRLHAPSTLLTAFRDIMEADEELRTELEDMTLSGATPLQLGIRIRTSPGMTVTARNKLKHAETVRDALAGKTLEVTRTRLADAQFNDDLLQRLVGQLGTPRAGTTTVWDDVPWERLGDTLRQFRETPSEDGALNGKLARSMSYIDDVHVASPTNLRRWTVALASREIRDAAPEPYGGVDVLRVRRGARDDEDGILNFGAISDPADEQYAVGARAGTSRRAVKAGRTPEWGLLIIYPILANDDPELRTSGVAVSFPEDREMRRHNYVLNPVAQAEARG